MNCPICGNPTVVKDSRKSGSTVTRRRECPECAIRFNTTEKPDETIDEIIDRGIKEGKWLRETNLGQT